MFFKKVKAWQDQNLKLLFNFENSFGHLKIVPAIIHFKPIYQGVFTQDKFIKTQGKYPLTYPYAT